MIVPPVGIVPKFSKGTPWWLPLIAYSVGLAIGGIVGWVVVR